MSARPSAREDFSYDLPVELIAQDPAPRRADARLLRLDPDTARLWEVPFRSLPTQLCRNDLLVLNDSRVLPARLFTRRHGGGGGVELLLVHPEPEAAPGGWLALARPVRRLRVGTRLGLTDMAGTPLDGPELCVVAVLQEGYVCITAAGADLAQVAERWGEIPLPPYIKRTPDDSAHDARRRNDRARYQTVYARRSGSVAAPTAGLHFEPELLEKLVARGIGVAFVTLHVGPGTFRPPTIAQVVARRLQREYFHYPAATDAALRATRERGGRVIAVGTTTLRVLETVHRLRDTALTDRASVQVVLPQDTDHGIAREGGNRAMFAGEVNWKEQGWEVCGTTRLFIRPPDKVVAADALLTNFHLPESSLLMLVAALAPDPLWRRAYRHAVDQRFRFYSYGDAMLILPQGRERSYES